MTRHPKTQLPAIRVLAMCVPALLMIGLAPTNAASNSGNSGLYSVSLKTIDGQATSLEKYRGKALLIVNTASQCGYTSQYSALEKTYQRFRDQGLVVLGFPSNDFGSQEPGSNAEIKLFCQKNYQVSFPLFEKASVSGSSVQPLYRELLKLSRDQSQVSWNFEKFVVSREGQVVERFPSGVSPDHSRMTSAIQRALAPVTKP
jgi:glutathione peroxidase